MSDSYKVSGNKMSTGNIHRLPKVDKTFKKSGYSADAKETGDRFEKVESDVEALRDKMYVVGEDGSKSVLGKDGTGIYMIV